MLALNHFNFLHLLVLVIVACAVFGWSYDKSKQLVEDKFNRQLRADLEERMRSVDVEMARLEAREKYIAALREQFTTSFLLGRKWLSKFIAEADNSLDTHIVDHLRNKKRPAFKAAEEVAHARAERRVFKERAKFLEYQLLSLKEYFPFLDEYEEVILDEAIPLIAGEANLDALEESDPVLRFVPKTEYNKLPSANRNQLALDRYLSGNLSPSAIGRLYERYLGYLWEQDGWAVEYHGIVEGFEDLGRDLICTKGNHIKIIQAKCWSSGKKIREKHIFQLFGTTQLFSMDREIRKIGAMKISAMLVTSTSLSPVARRAAVGLGIEVKEECQLNKSFPMIKCNINQRTKEKIYHLPFDQQYDRAKIMPLLGEFYAATVVEAEKNGFRRAFRFHGAES